MSKFQTIVEVPEYQYKTGYSKKNIFLGSCFTENIGTRMSELNYDVDINPFGILYNPESVANGIKILLENKEFNEADLIQHNGLWHSFYHHGKFSDYNKNTTLKNINDRIKESSEYLQKADFLFITFGTAWIYKFNKWDKTVSNCHKIPNIEFERVRLSLDEIVKNYIELIDQIQSKNPEIKITFTVSPIRHWKDGAIENQRSKSTLLLAVDQIIKSRAKVCNYFPSYEIVMDELRDYRFYTDDMLHISDLAVRHIWEKFEAALLSNESKTISKEIKKLKSALQHRPFNPFTKEHLKFLKKQFEKAELLQKKYPLIKFDHEKQNFMHQIREVENEIGKSL